MNPVSGSDAGNPVTFSSGARTGTEHVIHQLTTHGRFTPRDAEELLTVIQNRMRLAENPDMRNLFPMPDWGKMRALQTHEVRAATLVKEKPIGLTLSDKMVARVKIGEQTVTTLLTMSEYSEMSRRG